MPQFDVYSFPQQLVFLILAFLFLYGFVLRTFLPEIATVLKFRTKLVKFYTIKTSTDNILINRYYTIAFFSI